MSSGLVKFFLLSIFVNSSTNAYKILVMCPAPARSHNNLCRGIVDILAERGHEITLITSFPRENSNYREIGVPEVVEIISRKKIVGFANLKQGKIEALLRFSEFIPIISEALLNSETLKNFIADESEKFDAYILEYFVNDYLIGMGVRFDCPTIVLSPTNLLLWLTSMTNNPLEMATVPNLVTSFSSNMNLWERITNTGITLFQEIFGWTKIESIQEYYYKEQFPDQAKIVPYKELRNRISLTFVNSHPSMGFVRPLLPNAIEIGGYHIKEPEILSKDLKEIMDSATDGVIFFSMGSNLKSSEMNTELQNTILKVFATLKQTVLWKFEKDLPNKPKNVIISPWLPQTGILAHPNVKLFISHGGLLSCTEAFNFGIPMLIIPVYGDQHHIAMQVTDKGNGFHLSLENITEQTFQWSLKEALTNKKYMKNAQHLKNLFHDRPIKPRDQVGFYVEHVIRTKGANHLSPPILPRYSQLLLDVIVAVLTPLLALILLIIYSCKRIFKRKTLTKAVKIDVKKKN